ncbi:MAG: hypothetical protein ACLRRA_04775 [Acutalibacteraceae bacterium]
MDKSYSGKTGKSDKAVADATDSSKLYGVESQSHYAKEYEKQKAFCFHSVNEKINRKHRSKQKKRKERL